MALDGIQKRRIARLRTAHAAGTERGTGFCVGPRRLLTAFHVVGDRRAGALYDAAIAGEIRVEIDEADPADPAAPPRRRALSAGVVPGAFDARHDWALLACDAELAGPPLPLRKAPIGYDVPWSSFGYSDAEPPDLGMPRRGRGRSRR